MSSNDHHPSDSHPSLGQSTNLPVVPAPVGGPPNTLISSVGMPWQDAGTPDDGVNIVRLLHSLRRRMFLALGLGFAVAITTLFLMWWFIPLNYDAHALVRVRRAEGNILDAENQFRAGKFDYDIFKQTQAALMKSTFVINAALRKPGIGQLPMVRAEEDPALWLTWEMRVANPEDSEILRVNLLGEDPKQIEKIVNAIIDSYMTEIVQAERENDLGRLDILKRSYRKLVSDMKEKQDLISKLAKEVGAPESEQVDLTYRIEMDQLMRLRARREEIGMKLQDVEMNLMVISRRRDGGDFEPTDYEIEDHLETDPFYADAKMNLTFLQDQQRSLAAAGQAGMSSRNLKQSIQRAYADVQRIKSSLKPRIVDRILRLSGQDTRKEEDVLSMLQTEQMILKRNVDDATKLYNEQAEIVQNTIGFSSELEMRKAELGTMTVMMEKTKEEIDALDLNLQKRPRIAIIQRAYVPVEHSDRIFKYGLMFVVCVTLWGGTAFGISYWDYQAKRINGSDDVNSGTDVRIVGTLPTLDSRSLFSFGGLRGQSLEASLIESIDGVRTTLLCRNGDDPVRVVMVTSATAQEGKTTLAGQLAISLARSGRRTLLVDADVHNPQQHYVFGIPFGRGLCELLRREAKLDDVVQHVSVEGLSMIPAGYCDQSSLRAMASETMQQVFAELRADYDFIVVDSGPVLVVADPLLVGQHADTTILSLRRDVSRTPKINEACDRLRAVGIGIMGGVLNGASGEYRQSKLELAYDSSSTEEFED